MYFIELISYKSPLFYKETGKFICKYIKSDNVRVSCWNDDDKALSLLNGINNKLIKADEYLSYYSIPKKEIISNFDKIFGTDKSKGRKDFPFFDVIIDNMAFEHYLTEICFFQRDKRMMDEFIKILVFNEIEFVMTEDDRW